MDYLVATDGACKGNPGPGTWAFVVFDKQGEYIGHKKGSNPHTTNNEQELNAILEALKWANKHNKSLHILTDSNYCLQGITQWMHNWRRNYWKTKSGTVKNLHLWRVVVDEWDSGNHTIEKVKGHSGNKYNEMADMYCNEEFLNKFM